MFYGIDDIIERRAESSSVCTHIERFNAKQFLEQLYDNDASWDVVRLQVGISLVRSTPLVAALSPTEIVILGGITSKDEYMEHGCVLDMK